MRDTIYAPSTAIGGAIAILRVSGPEAGKAAALFDRDIVSVPGMLRRTQLMHGGETVDDCMAVFFKAPNSYTGEDMVEINCHGGHQSVKRILSVLSGLGFTPAGPGEFTRRAFENGKMDLSQAEAVMDVVNAGAERSHRSAVRQLSGDLRRRMEKLQDVLTDTLSGIDAAIDYPDEAEEDMLTELPESLSAAKREIRELLKDSRKGRILREGLRIVILGKPNVGKSSLLNALLGEERAIVTDIPGTTRDTIEEQADLGGVPVRVIDTAGIREASDAVEKIGVERARVARQSADLILLMLDGSRELSDEDEILLRETEGDERIIILNKCDLAAVFEPEAPYVAISAKEGAGLEGLKAAILAHVGDGTAGEPVITNERHAVALERALKALEDASKAEEYELAATDIREALRRIGEVTGTDVDESVIDRIFERFCVGK